MKTLDTTLHYKLVVGPNPYENNQEEYLIVNLETGVVEADSRMLPQAKKYLESLEAYYSAQEDFSAEPDFDDISEEEYQEATGYKFRFNKKH